MTQTYAVKLELEGPYSLFVVDADSPHAAKQQVLATLRAADMDAVTEMQLSVQCLGTCDEIWISPELDDRLLHP